MPKGQPKKLTADKEQFIKENYLKLPVKTIASHLDTSYSVIMNRLKKWGLSIPKEIVEQRKKQSQFQKGMIAFNKGKKIEEFMTKQGIENSKKTRFKKGNLPHNTNYNGHERITKDGYVEIRIKKGTYKLKHLYLWEQVNGKLPKGHCLSCLDGNKLNTNPSNWKLITRIENMYHNSRVNYPKEVIPSLVMVKQLENKLNNL